MNDLIWIGNTLYPRWTIFVAIGLVAVAAAAFQQFGAKHNDG